MKSKTTLTNTKENITPPLSLPLSKDDGARPLSDNEKWINDFLDTLPSFVLGEDRSPSWMGRIQGWTLPLGSVLLTFVILLLLGKSNAPLILGLVFFSFGVLASIDYWLNKKLKLSRTDEDHTQPRCDIIKRALKYVASPFLQGRLALLHTMVGNENIDQKFWQELRPLLIRFIEKESMKETVVSEEELKSFRDNYQKMISRTDNR